MKKLFYHLMLFITGGCISFSSCGQKQKASQQRNGELIAKNKSLVEIIIPASKGPGIGGVKGIPTGTELQLPPCIKIVERPQE